MSVIHNYEDPRAPKLNNEIFSECSVIFHHSDVYEEDTNAWSARGRPHIFILAILYCEFMVFHDAAYGTIWVYDKLQDKWSGCKDSWENGEFLVLDAHYYGLKNDHAGLVLYRRDHARSALSSSPLQLTPGGLT